MSQVIFVKTYEEPIFCEREILRYAGCKKADVGMEALLKECIEEAREKLTYKVCYIELPVIIEEHTCDFDVFRVQSEKLTRYLRGCDRAVVFAATVGVEMDRLIAKYSRLSPSKALFFQALGAERIEALCDRFCEDMATQFGQKALSRFSPGYGDLPLSCQKDIFSVLDCERKIGLTLNDSLLMSPTKSVTAFVSTGGDDGPHIHKCSACDMKNCAFRGML